ncbi:MAG: DUF6674 family protein [Bacilli bacterium]
MDKQLPSQLSQNEYIQAYLVLLNMMGNAQKKNDTMDLIQHIEYLEHKFDTVIDEIKELRQTVEQFQNPSTRLNLKTMIDKVDTSVQHAKNKLVEVKETFIASVKTHMDSLKSKGKNTVVKSLDLLHVQQGLKNIHQSLSFSIAGLNHFNLRVNQMSSEFKRAKVNFKNVGLLMIGKSPNHYNADKTKINLLQRVGKSTLSSLEKLQATVYKASNKIVDLEKYSVKKELKAISSEQSEASQINKTIKTITNVPR